jgi:hypothetical protein
MKYGALPGSPPVGGLSSVAMIYLDPMRWPPPWWVWAGAAVLFAISMIGLALGLSTEFVVVLALVVLLIGAPSTAAHYRRRWQEEERG